MNVRNLFVPILMAVSSAFVSDTSIAADSALSRFYSVIREPAQGLPDHTVFRPADLNLFDARSRPVVFWANGGCNASNFGFTYILTVMAARGFVLVANGAFDAVLAGGSVTPSKLLDAINWIETANQGSQFFGRLDTSRMAVAGQSCGGLEALVAGADPRIKSVLAFNTGFFRRR